MYVDSRTDGEGCPLDISVVVPLYNEEENVFPLYEELSQALDALDLRYEVIAVDDGSKDGSFTHLREIHARDPHWHIIRFRRNFGQTAALSAGFDAARGQVVITIDADLQNDPRDIPKLLVKIDEGYDIVSGWRVDRKEPFFVRRLPSMVANGLISRMSDVRLHDYGCTLKAYRCEVVKHIHLYGELHRFIPALASEMGATVVEVPVNDRPRLHGKSKVGLNRIFKVLLDLITVTFLLKFFNRPLYVFGGIGAAMGGLGVLIGLYLTFIKLFQGQSIGDRPLLLLAALLVLVGIQMVSTGLLGEVLMRTYHESQRKPIYVIREELARETALATDNPDHTNSFSGQA